MATIPGEAVRRITGTALLDPNGFVGVKRCCIRRCA
jgi:hypothetical protein